MHRGAVLHLRESYIYIKVVSCAVFMTGSIGVVDISAVQEYRELQDFQVVLESGNRATYICCTRYICGIFLAIGWRCRQVEKNPLPLRIKRH
jgi:hypothetical protein